MKRYGIRYLSPVVRLDGSGHTPWSVNGLAAYVAWEPQEVWLDLDWTELEAREICGRIGNRIAEELGLKIDLPLGPYFLRPKNFELLSSESM
jgi:hypothetical protein